MSGLLFPGEEDFFVARGSSGTILCTKINGFALILFYSTNCVYCKKLLPIFRKLPGMVGGCNFAMLNVAQARGVLRQAKNTVAPIEYVPFIIFYVNNKPYMRYNGPAEMGEIKNFVLEVANNVQNKQTFAPDKIKHPEREIPEYTIGKPLCGDGQRCYLEYEEAYPEEPPGTNAPSERKQVSGNKGQYLGYEQAYNSSEGPDPNQQYREEYAQRQLPPHQRQPQPQYPQQPQHPRQPQPRQPQYPQQQRQQQFTQQARPRYPPQQQQPQYPQQHYGQYQHPAPSQYQQPGPRQGFVAPHGHSRSPRQPQYGQAGY